MWLFRKSLELAYIILDFILAVSGDLRGAKLMGSPHDSSETPEIRWGGRTRRRNLSELPNTTGLFIADGLNTIVRFIGAFRDWTPAADPPTHCA